VKVIASYISGMAYFKPSTTHSDGQTHSDGIVIIGGNVQVLHSRVEGSINPAIGTGFAAGMHPYYPNPISMSAFMFNTRTVGTVVQKPAKIRIVGNWISGGIVGLNMLGIPDSFPAGEGSLIEYNRFKNDQGKGTGGWIIACQKGKQAGLVIRNNVKWDPANPMDSSVVISPRVDV